MSDKKKPSKKSAPIGTDTARKIWLAGVGAYGRAFSEAQDSLSKVTAETSRVFDDLVQKGEVIETMVSIKGKEAVSDVMDKVGGGIDVDDRIEKMRARLRRGSGAEQGDIEARLDVLEAKMDKILELLSPKTPAKKAPVKRTRSKKAPAKKAAVKKPTKKPTKKPASKA